MRHEHILKDDKRFLAGELRVAGIHRPAVDNAGVIGLAADDVSEARRVDAHRADHRPVTVGLAEPHGRHEDQPMRIDRAGLMHLGAGDVDAFIVAPHHMQEKIEIGLLVRRLGAVALGIGHGAADHHVGGLRALEKCQEAPVIIGAVLGIDVEGHRMAGADGIEPDAALEARAGALAQLALHFMLVDEIARRGRHMQKTVDLAVADAGMNGGEIGPLGGDPVGFRHGVDRRADDRVIDRLRHALAHEKHVHVPAAQRVDVFVRRRDPGFKIGPQCFGVAHRAAPAELREA